MKNIQDTTNMKKLYRIPCIWTVAGTILVEAENLEQAIQEADDSPLPEASDYIEGSFEVNNVRIPYLNKNLTEQEKAMFCTDTI